MKSLATLLLSFFALAVIFSFQPVSPSAAELVKYKIVGKSIPKSLTGKPGDAQKGVLTAINRRKGNCLACHTIPGVNQPDQGNIGPPLEGVAKRYKEGELRLRLVYPKKLNPDTIMPSFYTNTGLHRVLKKWEGKTIISAQDVEDIVAFLLTLNTYK
jgi:sulfur-oxidizing protein SoxX